MASTWTALKAEIATWMIRDDLTDVIPTFISFAEDRFNRTLRVPEMEADVTSNIGTGTVSLPSDFLHARSLYLDTDPKVTLTQLSLSVFRNTYSATTGQPRHFAFQSGNELVLGPTPDGDYDVVLNYYQKIPALGDDNADNWLLLAHPDLYLAAALSEGFAYTRDTEAMMLWESRAAARLRELEMLAQRKQHSATPQRLRSPVVV
jgi:hypothetical protein